MYPVGDTEGQLTRVSWGGGRRRLIRPASFGAWRSYGKTSPCTVPEVPNLALNVTLISLQPNNTLKKAAYSIMQNKLNPPLINLYHTCNNNTCNNKQEAAQQVTCCADCTLCDSPSQQFCPYCFLAECNCNCNVDYDTTILAYRNALDEDEYNSANLVFNSHIKEEGSTEPIATTTTTVMKPSLVADWVEDKSARDRQFKAATKRRQLRGLRTKVGNKFNFVSQLKKTTEPVARVRKVRDHVVMARSVRVSTGTEFPRMRTKALKKAFGPKVIPEVDCKQTLSEFRRHFKLLPSTPLPCCIQHLRACNDKYTILSQKRMIILIRILLARGCVEVHPGPHDYDTKKANHKERTSKRRCQDADNPDGVAGDASRCLHLGDFIQPRSFSLNANKEPACPNCKVALTMDVVGETVVYFHGTKRELDDRLRCPSESEGETVVASPPAAQCPVTTTVPTNVVASTATAPTPKPLSVAITNKTPMPQPPPLAPKDPEEPVLPKGPPPLPPGVRPPPMDPLQDTVLDGHELNRQQLELAVQTKFYGDISTIRVSDGTFGVKDDAVYTKGDGWRLKRRDERPSTNMRVQMLPRKVRAIKVMYEGVSPMFCSPWIPTIVPAVLLYTATHTHWHSAFSLIYHIARIFVGVNIAIKLMWGAFLLPVTTVLCFIVGMVLLLDRLKQFARLPPFWNKTNFFIYVPHLVSNICLETNSRISDESTLKAISNQCAMLNIPDTQIVAAREGTCKIVSSISDMYPGFQVESSVPADGQPPTGSTSQVGRIDGLNAEYPDTFLHQRSLTEPTFLQEKYSMVMDNYVLPAGEKSTQLATDTATLARQITPALLTAINACGRQFLNRAARITAGCRSATYRTVRRYRSTGRTLRPGDRVSTRELAGLRPTKVQGVYAGNFNGQPVLLQRTMKAQSSEPSSSGSTTPATPNSEEMPLLNCLNQIEEDPLELPLQEEFPDSSSSSFTKFLNLPDGLTAGSTTSNVGSVDTSGQSKTSCTTPTSPSTPKVGESLPEADQAAS